MPITRRTGFEGAVGLFLGVHLDQGGHAEGFGAVDQRREHVLFEGGDDQQDDVGAVGTGLVDLVRTDDEVLAQHRDVHGGAHGVEIGERSAGSGAPRSAR